MNYHLIPNWGQRVTETYSYLTTIFTSRSGKEQRVSERALPRRTVAFTTLLWGAGLQRAQALMHDRGDDTITIPDPARYAAALSLDAASGATTIVITSSPPWLEEGIALVLSDLTTSEFMDGGDIVNVGSFSVAYDDESFDVNRRAEITLDAALTRDWPAGSVVRPVITGRLQKAVSLDYAAASVADADVTLSVLPPSEAPDLGTADFETFDDRPVLLVAPNWAQPPSVENTTQYEEVDYNRGVIRSFLPIEFYTRITQFNYMGRSRESVAHLLSLFVQTRGRQGEFYSPSWTSDMNPVGGVISGTSTLTVAGSVIAGYDGSAVNGAIAIQLASGEWVLRRVTGITTTDEPGPGAFDVDYGSGFDGGGEAGQFSVLTFDDAIDQDIWQTDIAMICWLNICRFASDTLTIQWLNDDVGRVTLQVMTLEPLTAE